MSVTPSPIGGFAAQFFDNNGVILSGGKIYTYAAGTTTPQASYTSALGITPHSNPIILDSAGRVPGGEIWLTDGLVYKFKIDTANDILIGTYDNITGVNSNFVNYTVQEEVITATAGQTVFNLSTINYAPGTNSLSVYIDGVNQYVGDSYLETDSDTVTFTAGLHVGAEVKFTTAVQVTTGAVDANTVGYTYPASGAVGQTVQEKLEQYVSVKDFGAVGDGVTDDTTAIQNALNAIAVAGGELLFPAGTYVITSPLVKTFADGVNVEIRGYGAKIDATAISSLNAIELGGSRVSSTALGANVSQNSDTFTVASSTGISDGRILLITSTDLWNPTRPNYYKGELALVEKIVGTTITNSNPLYDGYTAATTTVHLLNMPQITVEGLEIECNDDVTALAIVYARSPVVRNCKVHGSRYAGIFVNYCLGGTVDSNFIYDVWNGIVTGTSYGVVVGTGQGIKVVNNTINNARHAIAGGGFEPLREVVYANNTCHNSTLENVTGCLDIHGNSEFAVVTGNIASSVTCAGINVIISNNILNSAETNVPGILIFQEIDSDYYVIKGNRISCAGATAFGVWVTPTETNLNIKQLAFEGNVIEAVTSAVFIQPRSNADTGCSITNLTVQNNSIKSTGAASAFTFANSGAATYALTDLISTGNVYQGVTHDAFVCNGNPIAATVSVGDTFKANRLNGSLAYFCGTDVRLTSPSFYGDVGGAGNSRSVYYDNTGRINVTNPVYTNVTFKAEIASATEYVENGWYSSTPTVLNTGNARLINFYGTLGRATTYGTAAPASGTWALGDRVINQDPAVGQPKSWVCTVAGTPGTWVSEGNL